VRATLVLPLKIGLAWHCAAMTHWSKNVLLVDLDPQFTASRYMLGVTRTNAMFSKAGSPTIWDIFKQSTRAPGLRSSGW
jgi:chromosome partitioning protein